MKKFNFVVEEFLSRNIIIEEENSEYAYEKLQEMYLNKNIVPNGYEFIEYNVENIEELEN